MKRSLFAFAALLAVPALAADARAADTPKYDELPVGRTTLVPTQNAPSWIGAREKVPGFVLFREKNEHRPKDAPRPITIVGDKQTADRVLASEAVSASGGQRACFAVARGFSVPGDEDAEPETWESSTSWQTSLWPKSMEAGSEGGVTAVHREELVDKDGTKTLEITDAWIDASTLGARKIASASVPLKLVSTVMGTLQIYAGRAETSAGKKTIEIIAVQTGDDDDRFGGNSLRAMKHDNAMVHGAGCGYLHVSLDVEPKSADSAVILTALPIGKDANVADARAKTPAPTFGKRARRALKLPDSPAMREVEVRLREAQVHVGVSQTSRDPSPIVTVTPGWAGRERTVRTMVPDTSKAPATGS